MEDAKNGSYDLCIVGAGMFGSAAARHASAVKGIKVCLIGPDEPTLEERATREIFGAHYDEGRITRIIDNDSVNLTLSKESTRRFRELEDLSEMSFYHPLGALWVENQDSPNLKKILDTTSRENIQVVDLSYGDIFQKRFPYIKLTEGDHPLLEDCGAGHISPRKMVAAQKKVAKEQGCFIINKVVNEVKHLQNGLHEVITEDGETLKTKKVLLCTGAFTNFKTFPMPKLKIEIIKETVVFFKLSLEEVQRLSSMPPIIYRRKDDNIAAYILPPIQYPDGDYYLKIGHLESKNEERIKTLEEVRSWYLSQGDVHHIEKLKKLILQLIPELRYEEVSDMTCVTCESPTGKSYIDRISPTVTVAVVGNGYGAKFSDEVGRIAATLSVTGRWESDLSKSHFQAIFEN